MADSYTTNLNLTKPEVGASTDTWGNKLNSNFNSIDGLFNAGPYLKIANGGTNAGTEAQARTNLGVPGIATTNNFTEAQTITINTSTSALKVIQSGAGPAIELNAGELVAGHTAPLAGISGATGVIQVNGTEGYQHASWSASNGASMQFLRSRATTPGTQTAVQSGDVISSTKFAGSDGTAFIPAAEIRVAVDGTPGTNDMPGRIAFFTTADGASSVTERLRLSSFGGIGIAGANYGTTGQVLASAGTTSAVLWQDRIISGTAIATTSGTNHDFTSIPSWVNEIKVVFSGVTNTNNVIVRLGTSSGFVETGYTSRSFDDSNSTTSTTGFQMRASTVNGVMTLIRVSSNNWVSSHAVGEAAGGGSISLAAALDRIRILGGSSGTFSAGSVNILYS